MNTPPFEVGSSPWKLSYTVDWNGNFAVTVKGNLVVNQGVSSGQAYDTYIYDTTGSVYFSVVSAPANGHWTISVVEYPSTPTPSPGTVFTYSGTGQMNTPPFEVGSSPWKLSYTVDWNGNFATTVKGNLVVNQGVSSGQAYNTYVYGATGSVYFSIVSAPANGHWTISVIAGL